MSKQIDTKKRIHYRIRKKVHGNAERPRVAVFRSARHFYMQAINDVNGTTLVSVSTIGKEKANVSGKPKKEAAAVLGELLGKKLKKQNIAAIVFDRGGFRYHGRVKAAAEGLRSAGIQF